MSVRSGPSLNQPNLAPDYTGPGKSTKEPQAREEKEKPREGAARERVLTVNAPRLAAAPSEEQSQGHGAAVAALIPTHPMAENAGVFSPFNPLV